MRWLLVLLFSLITYQAPIADTRVNRETFACVSPEVWMQYANALNANDRKTQRSIYMAQRCVYQAEGKIKVIKREGDWVSFTGKAMRTLYVPTAVLTE